MIKKYKAILVCLILLCTLIGCASLEKDTRINISSGLGKIGVISVYAAYGPAPGLFDYAIPNKDLEKTHSALNESCIGSYMMEEFTQRLTPYLLGDTLIKIGEDAPEIVSVEKESGWKGKKFTHKGFELEKLDYSSLGKRLGIDTLIILETTDNVRPSPQGALLTLTTKTKIVNISSHGVLWQKMVIGEGNIISGYDVDRAARPQIVSIVNKLVNDFY